MYKFNSKFKLNFIFQFLILCLANSICVGAEPPQLQLYNSANNAHYEYIFHNPDSTVILVNPFFSNVYGNTQNLGITWDSNYAGVCRLYGFEPIRNITVGVLYDNQVRPTAKINSYGQLENIQAYTYPIQRIACDEIEKKAPYYSSNAEIRINTDQSYSIILPKIANFAIASDSDSEGVCRHFGYAGFVTGLTNSQAPYRSAIIGPQGRLRGLSSGYPPLHSVVCRSRLSHTPRWPDNGSDVGSTSDPLIIKGNAVEFRYSPKFNWIELDPADVSLVFINMKNVKKSVGRLRYAQIPKANIHGKSVTCGLYTIDTFDNVGLSNAEVYEVHSKLDGDSSQILQLDIRQTSILGQIEKFVICHTFLESLDFSDRAQFINMLDVGGLKIAH